MRALSAAQSAALTALATALVATAAQYLGVTEPALRKGSEALAGLELAERQLVKQEIRLDTRAAKIERREARIEELETALETCGRGIP